MATTITGISLSTNTVNGLATITFSGAINETITYSGTSSGTVTLNGSGTGTANLPYGVYTFTGSVSGYSKVDVPIHYSQTVKVYPKGALYWFGLEIVPFIFTKNNMTNGGSLTKNTNYMRLYQASQGNSGTVAISTTPFDFTYYNTFNIRFKGGSVMSTYSSGMSYISSTQPNITPFASATTIPENTTIPYDRIYKIDISFVVGNGYVATGSSNGSIFSITFDVQAIWAE